MPIYEYRCEQCGHLVDLIQKRTDPPLETCSKCGGSMKKLLAAPALQFKGSGFYITDYSSKGKETDKATSDTGAPESKTAKESAPAAPAAPAADKKADKKSDAGGGGSAPPPASGGDGKT